MRAGKVVVGAVACATALGGGAVALAASGSPKGGKIQVFANPESKQQSVLITGAIGDYGRSVTVDKTGKPSENGGYVHLILGKGTLTIDNRQIDKAFQNAKPQINADTCSVVYAIDAPSAIVKGSGLYAGATGSTKLHGVFAGIAPRKNGKCSLSQNAEPKGAYGSFTGTGTVSFQ